MSELIDTSDGGDWAGLMGHQLYAAVQEFDSSRERTAQADDRVLGVSDVGHCREVVRRMILNEPPTDERSDFMPAFIGTAVGDWIEQALMAKHPEVRTQMEVRVTLNLQSGYEITLLGHPDIVGPNYVVDSKTKNGLAVVRRSGPTSQQRYQPHLYAKGLIDAGEIPEDSMVALAFWDRSGVEEHPYVWAEPFSRDVVREASEWLDDVVYAVRNNEEAPCDKSRDFCQTYCQYASVCPQHAHSDATGVIEDEEVQQAVITYVTAAAEEREAKRAKEAAKDVLRGVTGNTATHSVRWVSVPSSYQEAYEKSGYDRLYVTKRKITTPKEG